MRARTWLRLGAASLLVVLVGCTTAEVRSASAAVEAARAAGKDKECPADFEAAEALVKRAEALCNSCQTKEANALAAEAEAKAKALCPSKPAPAPVAAPEPPRAPSPTASLSAAMSSVEAGACTNLNWSTTNANNISIDQGVGSVDASGSRQVCPSSTTTYTLTATGAGGTRTSMATVAVAAKPAPPKPTDKLTIHVNFDTDKYEIRAADLADLQKAEAFVRKYSACTIEVDGHTDSRGSEEYNQGLSERRAAAVQKWLIDHGATGADKITTKGFGESNPIADNKTVKGRAENRRAEILVFCQ